VLAFARKSPDIQAIGYDFSLGMLHKAKEKRMQPSSSMMRQGTMMEEDSRKSQTFVGSRQHLGVRQIYYEQETIQ